MNYTEARRKVLEVLEAVGPEHFDMGAWFSIKDPECGAYNMELSEIPDFVSEAGEPFQSCGTTACWAGAALTAVIKHDPQQIAAWEDEDYEDFAGAIAAWMNVPQKLFYERNWPTPMQNHINVTMAETMCSIQEAHWETVVTWLKGEFPSECYPEFNGQLR